MRKFCFVAAIAAAVALAGCADKASTTGTTSAASGGALPGSLFSNWKTPLTGWRSDSKTVLAPSSVGVTVPQALAPCRGPNCAVK